LAVVHSSILIGVEAVSVRIEALVAPGFSGVHILGIPQDWARDARERLRTALDACHQRTDDRKILLQVTCERNMRLARSSPALLDFALAGAALLALQQAEEHAFASGTELPSLHLIGELRLSGEIEGGNCDAFPQATRYVLPRETILCLSSAARVRGERVAHFHTLAEFACWLAAGCAHDAMPNEEGTPDESLGTDHGHFSRSFRASFTHDFHQTLGVWTAQPLLGLGLVLALAGRFNLLVVGSPGVGKTHAIRKMERLLPPLSLRESSERHLLCAGLECEASAGVRPFRSPQHTCSTAGLIGNAQLQPGEFSLAHRGVLFLDEFQEFARHRTEILREPLELKRVHLARAQGSVTLPADFQLLAASNPCQCGYFFSSHRGCRCQSRERTRSLANFTGPLLDRFHMRIALVEAGSLPKEALRTAETVRAEEARLACEPFFAAIREAAADPKVSAELAARVLAQQEQVYFHTEHPTASQNQEKNEEGHAQAPVTFLPTARPEVSGLFVNQRSRLQTEALLATLKTLFPSEFQDTGVGGALLTVAALRNLEASLEVLMSLDGLGFMRSGSAFSSSRWEAAR